ncbi:MAG TPA: hypothetical protein PLU72_09695 [Candidatus Ozemobacteraceae bacterium]|nr:hypothetical protein [Candidatus Ozemobacteraceae bacterium]
MPLTIVGTVHLDPAGYDRLLCALATIGPDLVTVDVSRFAVEFRRSRGPGFLGRLATFRRADGTLPPALEAVEAQIAVPYELRAAEDWCRSSSARLTQVGNDDESRELLELFETELMSPENLARLAVEPVPSLAVQVRSQWETARRRMRSRGGVTPADERIASRLEEELASARGHLCHITGWTHCAPLAKLLENWSPELLLLAAFPEKR